MHRLPLSVCLVLIASVSYLSLVASPQTARAQNRKQLVKKLTAPLGKNLEKSLVQIPSMKLKEALALISTVHKLKGAFLVDRATFKAQHPDAPNILDTEVRFPQLRNVRVATAVQIALSQAIIPATFRIANNRVVIIPGSPPLQDHSRTSPLRKTLSKKTSSKNAVKLKMREAIALLSKSGDFTILISKHFRMENPDAPEVEDRTITIPKVKSGTYWQFLVHISNQVGGVPVVQPDHVLIVTKTQMRRR